jgi:signal transduction histidine kinase
MKITGRPVGINGTGLGLYLCRALVEQHEGQLWFESTEGAGLTFFIRLPLWQNLPAPPIT